MTFAPRRTLGPRVAVTDDQLRLVISMLDSGHKFKAVADATGLSPVLVGNIFNGRSHKARVDALKADIKA